MEIALTFNCTRHKISSEQVEHSMWSQNSFDRISFKEYYLDAQNIYRPRMCTVGRAMLQLSSCGVVWPHNPTGDNADGRWRCQQTMEPGGGVSFNDIGCLRNFRVEGRQ